MLRAPLAGPVLLIVIALLVPTVQLVAGVPMVGAGRAHDGAFAVSTLVQYLAELRTGHPWPGWAAAGFDGIGSPIFFFYPPGAYAFASLVALALPGVPAAGIVGIAQLLFRLGAIASCAAWLARRTTIPSALTGGALYALMPWVCTINPQVRLDFAECAAAAVVPLVFLAIDAAGSRVMVMILAVAASVLALTLVHLPSLVAASGLALVYAASDSHSWGGASKRAASTAAGIVLGMALAGWYLLPAIGLLHEISPSALWDRPHQPEGHFLLGLNMFHRSTLLINLGLLVPGFLVALTYGALILDRRRAGLPLPLHTGVDGLSIWPLAATFGLAALMAMPFSAPLWANLTPLRMVQFPGRFVMPASLLAAGLIAAILPTGLASLRRLVFASGLLLGAGAIMLAIRMGDAGSPAGSRTAQALSQRLANAPEYVPAAAASHGWLLAAQQVGISHDRASRLVPSCVQSRIPTRRDRNGALAFDLVGCHGLIVLPQFYFPGWIAAADGRRLTVTPDPSSGLIEVDVRDGTRSVSLDHVRLPIEQRGILISLAALLLYGAVWVIARVMARGPSRQRTDAFVPSVQRTFIR